MELFTDFSEKNNPTFRIGFPPSTLKVLEIDRWRQNVHTIPKVQGCAWKAARNNKLFL